MPTVMPFNRQTKPVGDNGKSSSALEDYEAFLAESIAPTSIAGTRMT